MPQSRIYLAILTVLLGLTVPPAYAKAAATESAQKLLGTFGKWHAYTFDEHDQQVCYMSLSYVPASSKKFKRGTARLTITHRPAEGSKDVVSYTPGYAFKPESVVKVKVGAKTFELFTTRDTAWARDTSIDRTLSAAIHTGKSMSLIGVPERGAGSATDSLDLMGSADAYLAIDKACGLEVEESAPAKPKKPTQTTRPKVKININKQ